MRTDFIKGIVVPILTPIDENEMVDEKKLRDQVDFVINGGVEGILAFGSNGEFYMVDEDEMERSLEIIISQANGRVPVYFGIGAIKTRKCIALAKMAEKKGADGISVLQPMFLKPTEDELYTHFESIANAVPNLPMLLYNNPGRTGYTMSGALVEKLARNVENIVGMKDSSGDMTQTAEFIRRTLDLDFKVFGGKDTLLFASLCHGAVGGVCTTANFMPELITSIYDKYIAGDVEGALKQQFILNPVRLSMDKASFPVATKDMANMRGRDVGVPYLPNKATPKGAAYDGMYSNMKSAGLL
ncbi:MAG: dihydrodipicolinate synthase family protein [Eubacteriales bacterium]|nr:dihydrodipicolinate synthase family protein [Eubacteriales bacterium]